MVGTPAASGLSADNIAAIFRDEGFRYAKYPAESPDGIYIYRKQADILGRTTAYGGKMVSIKALPSYFALPDTKNGNPIYGAGFQTAISLPSGYYVNTVDYYFEEDTPGAGYMHQNYFRFTVGYQALTDMPLIIGAGLSGVMAGLPSVEGDNMSADGTASGIGAEFELHYLFGCGFVLNAGVSPAIGSGGSLLFDGEAGVGYFTGPVEYFIGYRILFWPDNDYRGVFFGMGLWF